MLLLILTSIAVCQKKIEHTPLAEDLRVLRQDGCKGPEETQEMWLMGKRNITVFTSFLKFCYEKGYLKGYAPFEVLVIPPVGISCEGIPDEELQADAVLIHPDDLVVLGELLLVCRENIKTDKNIEKREALWHWYESDFLGHPSEEDQSSSSSCSAFGPNSSTN